MKTRNSLIILFAIFAAACQPCPDMTAADDNEHSHVRKPLPNAEKIAKLPEDGGKEFNRLVFEHSPYLRQHARNPVDWRPWGKEAFAEAKKQGKPVFLSIGYTTCHWCHVMEHESFEDEEVAKMINDNYIAIKVDREERPDIDEVYMAVTQAMTGHGGWPMTVFLTPDKDPFFAGTYFPKESVPGRPGIKLVLKQLNEAWVSKHEEVVNTSKKISEHLSTAMTGTPGGALEKTILDTAFKQFSERYDATNGGFSTAPKFPVPPNLMFLLRYHKRSGDPAALEMVERTLTAMRQGGVYDHVGFGIHRYSTDPVWLVPHFEKMLYDQALVAMTNIEAYQVTGKERYAQTAREIFTYVLRDMTSEEGGFYSAEDADSEGEEGKFYIWTIGEVKKVLGEEDGAFFAKTFHLTEKGNFNDEATRAPTGSNIPHLKEDLSADAQKRVELLRKKLFTHREKRIHPQKDDKILTDWNGLMISALARAAQVLEDKTYADAATKAADFVLDKLTTKDGRLIKRYRQGNAGLTAHLEDYEFMIWGLLDLYETTFDLKYLEKAIAFQTVVDDHFWDTKGGGYFMTADDSEKLIVRAKKLYGGAIPGGNAVAVQNLVRLSRITADQKYTTRTTELIQAFSGEIAKQPMVYPMVLCALDFQFGPSNEIVIAGKTGSEDVSAMQRALQKPFYPNKVILFRPDEEDGIYKSLLKIANYTETQVSEGVAKAYVCKNHSCKQPTTDIVQMLKNMAE